MSDLSNTNDTIFSPQTPYTLVDEVSPTEIYVGVSVSGRDGGKATWQIKRIIKNGSTWFVTQFPDGDQAFKFIWDNRFSYSFV